MVESRNWFDLVCRWCQLEGLQPADAEDCVWQTFERYRPKRNAYPWEEEETEMPMVVATTMIAVILTLSLAGGKLALRYSPRIVLGWEKIVVRVAAVEVII